MRVKVDDERGGYVAAAHLLSLGRRSVAIVTGPMNSWPGIRRLDGYRKALQDWGHPVDSRLVVEGDFTFQGGAKCVRDLLDRGADPDGIVVGNDLMAIGAISHLRERHLRVPEDVAIIGYDDTEVGRFYDPAISTIAQPKYQLGHRGVEILIDVLEAAERDPESPRPPVGDEILDCTLVARRSSLGRPGEINCGSIFDVAPWEKCIAGANNPLSGVPRRAVGDERR
jgi:DNA-binding LacI/PurR family transcriptional regulator